jgi:hypothetical protein
MMKSKKAITERDLRAERKGFLEDEQGAVMLEFLIVLFAWMFLLFGVIQIGLIAIASYYVNYANFMALRTASVHYEYVDYGWINYRQFRNICEHQAAISLTPMEPKRWREASRGIPPQVNADFMRRVRFVPSPYIPNARTMRGLLEYDYYLIVPFANYVIAAFDSTPPLTATQERRVMQNFRTESAPTFPTIRLRSNNNADPGGPPGFHDIVIQRRWRYN